MTFASAPQTAPAAPTLLGRPFHWFHRARDRRRARLQQAEFRDARLALGRQMFAAGIDDGETGEQIAGLVGDSPDAWARRTRLFIHLADAALEDDAPLPGADAEFGRALELKRALAG